MILFSTGDWLLLYWVFFFQVHLHQRQRCHSCIQCIGPSPWSTRTHRTHYLVICGQWPGSLSFSLSLFLSSIPKDKCISKSSFRIAWLIRRQWLLRAMATAAVRTIMPWVNQLTHISGLQIVNGWATLPPTTEGERASFLFERRASFLVTCDSWNLASCLMNTHLSAKGIRFFQPPNEAGQ